MIPVIIACLAGGLGRRVAGGAFEEWTGLDIGDIPVRLFFGCTLALGYGLAGGDMYVWLCLPISTMLGCSVGMFDSITLGHGPGADREKLKDEIAGLTAHGVLSMGITAVPVLALAVWANLASIFAASVFIIAGLTIVPLYWIGWQITGMKGFLLHVPRRSGLSSATEFGEVFWGMACGLGAYTAGAM